ncbi:MAG: hypothetical protein ACXW4T_05830 [Candidatus Limnocylindrales bacterium]
MRLNRRSSRGAGARWLGLYPRAWRARYGAEMVDVLDRRPLDRRARVDLARGALDAHLHPLDPPRVSWVVAIVAGIAWFSATALTLAEPVPPDWPGYLAWTLPLGLVGAAAGLVAVVTLGRRSGIAAERADDLALLLAVVGHVAWIVAFVVAVLGGPYGAITAAMQTLAGIGTVAVGLARWRRADHAVAESLLVLGAAFLIPAPAAWLLAAGAWVAIAVASVRERSDRQGRRPVPG